MTVLLGRSEKSRSEPLGKSQERILTNTFLQYYSNSFLWVPAAPIAFAEFCLSCLGSYRIV